MVSPCPYPLHLVPSNQNRAEDILQPIGVIHSHGYYLQTRPKNQKHQQPGRRSRDDTGLQDAGRENGSDLQQIKVPLPIHCWPTWDFLHITVPLPFLFTGFLRTTLIHIFKITQYRVFSLGNLIPPSYSLHFSFFLPSLFLSVLPHKSFTLLKISHIFLTKFSKPAGPSLTAS